MRKEIKKISLALIALGVSTSALAANSPFCVTIPNQQGGFTVGGDLLWMRPTLPNLVYTQEFIVPTSPTSDGGFDYRTVNPNYDWGFDLMAAYRFPCTANDITALWTHLGRRSSNDDTEFDFAVDPLTGLPSPATARASTSVRYDAVDLDLGQRVNFGDRFNFRVFAGVRGADIDHKLDTSSRFTFPGSLILEEPPYIDTYDISQDSEFRGFGPQGGIEGRYCLGYGFGIDASTTFSALVGRQDSDVTFTRTFVGIDGTTQTIAHNKIEKRDRLVPALDMNLGLDYTFNFNNCSRSSLVVQAGYKVIHYWGADDLAANTLAILPADVGNHPAQNNAGNISFDGPYVGLKVNV